MLNGRVDYHGFSEALKLYAAGMRKDMQAVLKEQGKLLVVDLVRYTPPTVTRIDTDTALNKQRHVGEEAIKYDLLHLFLDPVEFAKGRGHIRQNEKLMDSIRKYTDAKDLAKLQDLFRRLKVKVPVVADATASHHKRWRGAGGRTLRTGKQIVVNQSGVTKLMRQMWKRVGMAKAGWVESAKAVGLKLPAWITRQRSQGKVVSRLGDPNKPYIEFHNQVPYIVSHDRNNRIISRACNNRVKRMMHRVDYVAANVWKKGGMK